MIPVVKQPQPRARKLCDSCSACAASKVRCSKETPACARCVRRGTRCEYPETKRVSRASRPRPTRPTNREEVDGDNSDNSSNNGIVVGRVNRLSSSVAAKPKAPTTNKSPSTKSPAIDTVFPAPHADVMSNNTATLPNSAVMSPFPPAMQEFEDCFGFNLGADNSLQVGSTQPCSDADFDGFLASMLASTPASTVDNSNLSATQGAASPQLMSSPPSSNLHDPFGSLFMPDYSLLSLTDPLPNFDISTGTSSQFPTPSGPISPEIAPCDMSQCSKMEGIEASSNSPPSCSCLSSLLEFQKVIHSNAAVLCQRSDDNTSTPERRSSNPPTLQAVVRRNQEILASIRLSLSCSCSQDAYILSMASMTLLKVLDWYSCAARLTSNISESHGSSSGPVSVRTLSSSSLFSSGASSVRAASPSYSYSESTASTDLIAREPGEINGYIWDDGEESNHMISQLVMSELHGVQDLVKQMTIRSNQLGSLSDPTSSTFSMEKFGIASSTLSSPRSSYESLSRMTGEFGESACAVSMLECLNDCIRRRVRSISNEIMESLRQE